MNSNRRGYRVGDIARTVDPRAMKISNPPRIEGRIIYTVDVARYREQWDENFRPVYEACDESYILDEYPGRPIMAIMRIEWQPCAEQEAGKVSAGTPARKIVYNLSKPRFTTLKDIR